MARNIREVRSAKRIATVLPIANTNFRSENAAELQQNIVDNIKNVAVEAQNKIAETLKNLPQKIALDLEISALSLIGLKKDTWGKIEITRDSILMKTLHTFLNRFVDDIVKENADKIHAQIIAQFDITDPKLFDQLRDEFKNRVYNKIRESYTSKVEEVAIKFINEEMQCKDLLAVLRTQIGVNSVNMLREEATPVEMQLAVLNMEVAEADLTP